MAEHSKRSIEQYYAVFPEHDRLSSATGQLEFERTKIIVQRFLSTPPAIVADIGGGTGPYSFWLASLGYETHLIEPSIRLVEICRKQMQSNASQAKPQTVKLGDACSLWFEDASCDAVLCSGRFITLPSEMTEFVLFASRIGFSNPAVMFSQRQSTESLRSLTRCVTAPSTTLLSSP